MTEPRIKNVTYEKEYRISIQLQNGHGIIYNMQPKLTTARFRDLECWDIFQAGTVSDSGKSIIWNKHTELSIDEILLQIKDVKKGY